MGGAILFVGPSRVGDGVLVTGLVDQLVRAGARLTLACGPAAMPLFDRAPGIDRRIVVTKSRAGLHWLGLWAATVGRRWQAVIDLRGSVLGYLLCAGERRVYRPVTGSEHRLDTLARAAGLSPVSPCLWLNEADRDTARALVGEGRYLVLGPTANWPGKIWPADRFVDLARALVAPGGMLPGARVVVLGGADKSAMAAPVLAGLADAVDLVGRTSLGVVGAVLAGAALFVGNDSGQMHMAAAAGAPTVGLFGPSRAEHYAPRGPRALAVRTPEPYEALFLPGYDRHTTGSLMTSLQVEPVLEACRRVLKAA